MGPILQNFNVTDGAANSDYRYSWYQSHHESPQMYGTNVWYKCMVQMNIYITSFMGCIGLPRTMEYIIVLGFRCTSDGCR